MRIAAAVLLLITAGASSCASRDGRLDGGSAPLPERDAGPSTDAGISDSGAPSSDAGTLDAGEEEDAGLDAGPSAALGEPCTYEGTPRCASGLSCVRPSGFTNEGVCQVDCAVRDEGGNVVAEEPARCDDGTTCQAVTTPTRLVLGVVCLPPVEARDELCPAPEDPDACVGDLTCAISASEFISGVLFVDEARCKLPCDADDAAADEGCPLGESCLGPRSPVGTGVCGRAVPLWDGALVPDATQQCNESTGHDYCDDRPLRGLAAPAELECVTGFYLDAHVGLCLAQCSQPRFDYNQDGAIVDADGEAAQALECPSGYVCDQQRARDFGLVEPVDPELPCDDFGCVPGEPCPACGTGAECVLDLHSGASICAAVYGFCVQAEASDAGTVDAG